VGSRIEPGVSPAEDVHVQSSLFQVEPVEVCNLQLSPGGGPEVFRLFHHRGIVEVEPHHGVVGFGAGGFLFEREHPI